MAAGKGKVSEYDFAAATLVGRCAEIEQMADDCLHFGLDGLALSEDGAGRYREIRRGQQA